MELTNKIEKIFIIHYKPLLERKQYLINYFINNNITNYEFRDLYQRENLSKEIKDKYFKLDNLNPAQICITIEHIETYRQIINDNKNTNKWYLILEDDAIFCDNFIDKINEYLKVIPDDAEYLDICDYFQIDSNNMWVLKDFTRTNCSYLINKNTCEKIIKTIIPFEKAIDHELNRQFQIHDIKCYWSNLSFIHHGAYESSYTQF